MKHIIQLFRSPRESAFEERICPMCKRNNTEELVRVDPRSFSHLNSTFNLAKMKSLGFFDLPFVPVVRCLNCDFIYTKWILSSKFINLFYNEIIESKKSREKIFLNTKKLHIHNVWSSLYRYWLTHTQVRDLNLLDYGCGWGDFLLMAQNFGVHGYGVEYDKRKIKFAKSHNLGIYRRLEEIDTRVNFHIIYINQVLEHVDRPFETLYQIGQRLDKRFVGYISVPDYPIERIREVIKLIVQGSGDKNFDTFGHINYFDSKSFNELLRSCNMELFDITNGQSVQPNPNSGTTGFIRFSN